MRVGLKKTFHSLTVRNYRIFAIGQLVKLIGVWMMFVAQDWLVLQISDDSAVAVGVVTALQFLPVLLFVLVGGRLADRYDKVRILQAANAAWGIGSLTLAVLVATGAVQLWHVYLFAALLGVSNAIETPVRQAFVSEMVPLRLLANGLSLSAATFNAARIIGPALAGVAIAAIGLGPVFLLSAAISLAPLISLAMIRSDELVLEEVNEATAREDGRIRDGLRYVWHRPDLRVPLLLLSVVALFGINFQVTLPVLAKTVFQTDAAAFGLITSAFSVGALFGALASSWRRARPSVHVVLGAAILFGLLETILGFIPIFWLALGMLTVVGFVLMFLMQATNQRIQLGVDSAFRGRVMSLWTLVVMGTLPVSAPAAGWVAEHLGAAASIWLGGLVSLLAAVVATIYQLRSDGDRLRLRLRPLPRLYVVSTASRKRVRQPATAGAR